MGRGKKRGSGSGGRARLPSVGSIGDDERYSSANHHQSDNNKGKGKRGRSGSYTGPTFDGDELDDSKVVLEGSDEEIDEEMAFNSSDEDQYGDVFGSIMGRRKASSSAAAQDEKDDEEEHGPGISLMSMLDDDDDEEEDAEEVAQGDGNDEEEEEEQDASDVDEGQYSQLVSLVSQISGGNANGKKKKKTLRTEARAEGEYNAQASSSSGKLSLDTLVGSMKNSVKHSTLKKRLAHLERAAEIQEVVPKVVQDRADRKVAYGEAKEEVTKWQPLVKKNRESKRLVFTNGVERINNTTAKMASTFQPQNDFEKEINGMLEASGLASAADVRKAEVDELKANKYTKEEIRERQKELAKLRALMFYEEQKAKRVKKIKSKMYRKLKKRREHREEEKAKQRLREIDPEAARAMDEEDALQRAKERMSLRHKNTSKYIKGLLRNGGIGRNSSAKEAITEQLRRGEALKKQMHTVHDGDSSEDENEDEETLRRKAGSLLEGIDADMESSDAPKKGLFALKFMQRNLDKQKEAAKKNAEALVDDFGDAGDENGGDSSKPVIGRRKFGGPVANRSADASAGNDGAAAPARAQIKSRGVTSVATTRLTTRNPQMFSSKFEADESNPWLHSDKPKRKAKKAPSVSEATKVHVDVSGASEKRRAHGDDEQLEKDAEQAKMMQLAFHDVGATEEAFVEEQRKAIDGEHAVEEEPDMVGWGSWAGEGVKVSKKRKGKSEEDASKKKKARVPRRKVIISAKRNKKAAVYLTESVPYPFKTKEQYAMSLQNPLGSEWQTLSTYKTAIKPRVSTQTGAIIQPIKMTKTATAVSGNEKMRRDRKKKEMRLNHQRRRKAVA